MHEHPYYRGARRRREREGDRKIFQEIIAKNFPNMEREPLTQIQKVQQVPCKINPRRNTPRHTHANQTNQKTKY